MNVVCLLGRLTATPEQKTTQNGVSVTSFSVAVDRAYQPKGAERQTDFINCVAWRGTAEFARYVAKPFVYRHKRRQQHRFRSGGRKRFLRGIQIRWRFGSPNRFPDSHIQRGRTCIFHGICYGF